MPSMYWIDDTVKSHVAVTATLGEVDGLDLEVFDSYSGAKAALTRAKPTLLMFDLILNSFSPGALLTQFAGLELAEFALKNCGVRHFVVFSVLHHSQLDPVLVDLVRGAESDGGSVRVMSKSSSLDRIQSTIQEAFSAALLQAP